MKIFAEKIPEAKDECPFSFWYRKEKSYCCVVKKRKGFTDFNCDPRKCKLWTTNEVRR